MTKEEIERVALEHNIIITMPAIFDLCQHLIRLEREACAKICDEREFANVYGVKECAAIIRSRD